jgi:hypothetical protein
MAMEIRYSALAPTERVVQVDEQDLAALNEILVDCFITHLKYGKIDPPVNDFEQKAVALCHRYSVDPNDQRSRVTFFKALLGQ